MKEPKTFQELITWACCVVIQGITRGERLESSIHTVLEYARRWKPAEPTGGRG